MLHPIPSLTPVQSACKPLANWSSALYSHFDGKCVCTSCAAQPGPRFLPGSHWSTGANWLQLLVFQPVTYQTQPLAVLAPDFPSAPEVSRQRAGSKGGLLLVGLSLSLLSFLCLENSQGLQRGSLCLVQLPLLWRSLNAFRPIPAACLNAGGREQAGPFWAGL